MNSTRSYPMEYDPTKDRLGALARKRPWLRRMFYRMLDLVFLRTWYVHRQLKRILPHAGGFGRPPEVLDAGTGFGQYAWYIARKFPEARILAVDVKQEYLDDCRAFFSAQGLEDRVRFEKADLTATAEPPLDTPERFDFILCVDVMEHIEDDVGVLRNFHFLLKPNGYVLTNTPSDQGGSDVKDRSDESFIGEHVREGYSPQEMAGKMRLAGLHVVNSEYGYGPFGSVAWRVLVKWPMLMLGASFAFIVLLPFYYVLALPVGVVFNAVDLWLDNKRGTGLTVLAQKL